MKQTINKSQFRDAFNGLVRGDQFSYEALGAIFDWIEEYEEGCGPDFEIELDPIAICCEWSEYENLAEVKENYDDIENLEDLHGHTTVLELSGDGLVIVNF